MVMVVEKTGPISNLPKRRGEKIMEEGQRRGEACHGTYIVKMELMSVNGDDPI